MDKYYKVITYGCQMNVHESEKLSGALEELGYKETTDENAADIIVFNTCCIRENAEQHAYGNIGALKQIKKRKPELIIAVGGCMTQQTGAGEKLKKTFPFVDIVFGTHNLDGFRKLVERKQRTGKRVIEILDSDGRIIEEQSAKRTSYPNGWVNVMFGCNNFCSYCIVPYVRGRERSRKRGEIVTEVRELIKSGYKEITLLGQNVNSYGNDLSDGTNFSELLDEICSIEGKYRLRFMSNHPKDFSLELVKSMVKNKNVAHSVHLPLQSGSDRILKLMNRRYTSAQYLEKIAMLKEYLPDCTVTTDMMVGFPTETEEDFADTLRVAEKADFSGAFTFVYSRRSGTVADKMDGQIDEETKKERIMRLVAIQNERNREQSKTYLGKTVEILCEDYDEKKGMYLGRDEYNRMGYFKSEKNRIGEFIKIKITETGGISLVGEIEEKSE